MCLYVETIKITYCFEAALSGLVASTAPVHDDGGQSNGGLHKPDCQGQYFVLRKFCKYYV